MQPLMQAFRIAICLCFSHWQEDDSWLIRRHCISRLANSVFLESCMFTDSLSPNGMKMHETIRFQLDVHNALESKHPVDLLFGFRPVKYDLEVNPHRH